MFSVVNIFTKFLCLTLVVYNVRSFDFPSNGQAPPQAAPPQGIDR